VRRGRASLLSGAAFLICCDLLYNLSSKVLDACRGELNTFTYDRSAQDWSSLTGARHSRQSHAILRRWVNDTVLSSLQPVSSLGFLRCPPLSRQGYACNHYSNLRLMPYSAGTAGYVWILLSIRGDPKDKIWCLLLHLMGPLRKYCTESVRSVRV